MNIKQINYIVALEEEGNLTRAAARLGLSQSALSKYLNTLEESLGVSLFVRNRGQLTATPYGRIYTDAARQILSLYASARQTIAGMEKEPEELLLGLPWERERELFALLLPALRDVFPGVTLRLRSASGAELLALVREEKLPMTLIESAVSPGEEFDSQLLLEEPLLLAVPAPAAPSGALSAPVSLEEEWLRGLPFLLQSPGSPVRLIADSLFAAARVKPLVAGEADSSEALLRLVGHGAGCAFLPAGRTRRRSSQTAGPDVPEGRGDSVRFLPLAGSVALKLLLVTRPGTCLAPAESWCAGVLKHFYGG